MKLIDLLVQELPKRGGWPTKTNDILALRPFMFEHKIEFTATPGGQWLHQGACCSVSFETYKDALAASKQVEWDGRGLPPVGATCEHCPGGTTQTDWEVVTVLGISERPGGGFTDYWLRKEDGSSYIIGNPYRFRPIRTEAERKREEAKNIIA